MQMHPLPTIRMAGEGPAGIIRHPGNSGGS